MNKTETRSEAPDMLKPRTCFGCGAVIHAGAPEQLCPRCLLGLGLGLNPGQIAPTSPAPPHLSVLSSPEEALRFEDYELLEEIARGGMGIVYRARQLSLKRIVAVKVLLFGQFASAEFVQRFRAEAEAVASLRHPHIVQIFAQGEHRHQHYFSMEYIEGPNLAGLVRNQPLPPRQAATLVQTLAGAIAYAHRRGILHRDLKPSNILIDLEGQPHITDFGLAKRLSGDNPVTLTGHVFGSPGFMAPEQAAPGGTAAGPAGDIYSLGGILYYSLTGRPPFVGDSLETILAQALTAEVLSPRKLNPNLPPDLETICLKCLERDPGRRYGSAHELEQDLQHWLQGEPIHARPVSPMERVRRWSSRNPLIAGLTVLVWLLLVGLFGYILFSSGRIRDEAARARRAEQQARAELWQSYLAQSRAERRSGQAGQRFASLAAIRRAAAIRPSLELRNEAIAALALPDVRLSHAWPYDDSKLAVGYSGSLDRFAVQRPDGQISVCLASNGMELARLPRVDHAPRWIAGFTPDERFLAVNYYQDLNLVWDVAAGQPVLGPLAGANCAWLPDINALMVAGLDSALRVYSLKNGSLVRSLPVPEPFEAIILRAGTSLIGGFRHRSKVFHLIDGSTGSERFALEHPAEVGAADLSADGQWVAVGCYDGHIYVWNTATGTSRAVLAGHENNVVAVGFNHAGTWLASTSWDDTFRLWDTSSWQQLLVTSGMSYEMRFDPADRALAHLQHGGSAGLLDLASSTGFHELHVAPEEHQEAWCVAVAPNGHWLATGHNDGAVLRDLSSGAQLARISNGYCRAVMFLPDNSALVTSGGAGLQVWPIVCPSQDAHAPVSLGPPRPIRRQLQFLGATLGGDGRWVAAANQPAGAVSVYEVAHPQNRFGLTNLPGVQFVSAPADMRWIAAGTWGGTGVKVWDRSSRRLECALPVAGTARVEFSPDGRLLVTGATSYEIWQTGSWRRRYEVHKPDSENASGTAVFSPDSQVLALLESGRQIVLVQAGTGAELATLEAPHAPAIACFCFSPDGSRLVALQANQSLQVWDLKVLHRQLAALNLDW